MTDAKIKMKFRLCLPVFVVMFCYILFVCCCFVAVVFFFQFLVLLRLFCFTFVWFPMSDRRKHKNEVPFLFASFCLFCYVLFVYLLLFCFAVFDFCLF